MTIRTNYVDIPIGHNEVGVALTTRYDFPAVTLVLPESPSRVFRSVEMEVTCRGTEVVATSPTAWLLGIKLGAVAFNDSTTTSTITNSGEQQTLIFTRDVTSYFVTNFGTLNEQTCQIGVTITAIPVNNISARLRITYEFDDADQKVSGTATSGGASTLTDSGKAWTTDDKKHWFAKITGGTGSGQVRKIASNTATVLTVTPAWSTAPDSTSTYVINLGRVTTVAIPLDSYAANLTNALVEIGTNQVPLLDTFCPEADKTFLHKFFEVTANEVANFTTDYTLDLALDAEAADPDGSHEAGLNVGLWYRRLWIRDDMTTNAVHAFKAAGSVTACFNTLSAVLFVTYLYHHADSTTILNSLVMTMPAQSDGAFGGSTSSDPQRWEIEIYVEEPDTITLRQSAVQVHFIDFGAIAGLNVRVGAQSYRAYTHASGSTNAGAFVLAQRFDSGGLQGSGLTLARGRNLLTIDIYRTSTASGTLGFPQGNRVFLNYTSGKHANGVGAHAHTTYWSYESFGTETGAPVFVALAASFAPNIPETNWFAVNIGMYVPLIDAVNGFNVILDAQLVAGEGAGGGWMNIASATQPNDTELACVVIYSSRAGIWQRYNGDPDTRRMALETARITRAFLLAGGRVGWGMYLSYHNITFTVSGVVRGYSGAGSGITVKLFRSSDDVLLKTGTTTSGGAFSFDWFDSAGAVYVLAFQDDNRTGRSKSAVAGTGFDIYISPVLSYPMGS